MPIRAMGPTFAGGTQPIVHGGYNLIFLPDVNNWELQRAGEAPVFYWVPNQVRMARKDGPDTGDFLFNLIRFAGVQSAETTVGATEDREVAGGVLTFTITGSPPDRVLEESQQQIIQQFQTSNDFFWGIRSGRQPIFRPAIVKENITTISNISPSARGGVPVAVPKEGSGGKSLTFRNMGSVLPAARARSLPRTISTRDASESTNLDPWYWRMQGEGAGSIDPSGQNAFSALVGAYPTAILWEAFHGTASPVIAIQNMKLFVWTPAVELTVEGHWDRIFEHFSAAASGRYLWASVDIQAEFNNMRTSGDITVDLKVDTTIPNYEQIQEQIEERSDLVFEKFMEEARRVIFEPPQPEVEAAEASSGNGLWGVGLALKYRRDSTSLDLRYHEERQLAYLQDHTVSSSLSGMFEEMKSDPDAERKYFLSVYLDDWPRKMARVVKPVLTWDDGAVDFLSVQIGYPSTQGDIMWEGHLFQKSESNDDSWTYRMTQKPESDVSNPPAGWSSDQTFIKRKVHLAEPPSETQDPYRRIQIDRNVIELDPEPNGSLMNDPTIEVRADSAGRLAVGPIDLGVILADNTQTVEVTLEPTDGENPPRPIGREPVRFIWNFDDQDTDRLWMLFTGDPSFMPHFRYQVRVIVKGTIFEPGREWTGPWVAANGSGPITIRIPRPGDPGVEKPRSLPSVFTQESPQNGSKEGPSKSSVPVYEDASDEEPSAHGWPLASG